MKRYLIVTMFFIVTTSLSAVPLLPLSKDHPEVPDFCFKNEGLIQASESDGMVEHNEYAKLIKLNSKIVFDKIKEYYYEELIKWIKDENVKDRIIRIYKNKNELFMREAKKIELDNTENFRLRPYANVVEGQVFCSMFFEHERNMATAQASQLLVDMNKMKSSVAQCAQDRWDSSGRWMSAKKQELFQKWTENKESIKNGARKVAIVSGKAVATPFVLAGGIVGGATIGTVGMVASPFAGAVLGARHGFKKENNDPIDHSLDTVHYGLDGLVGGTLAAPIMPFAGIGVGAVDSMKFLWQKDKVKFNMNVYGENSNDNKKSKYLSGRILNWFGFGK